MSQPPIPTTISRLVFLACLGIGALAQPPQALAQEAGAQAAAKRYDIAAGPLDQVLSRFAAGAGVMLSIDASLTDGKHSAGLAGSYTVADGFAHLLADSGLAVQARGNHQYFLRPVGAASVASVLSAVTVKASADATTEGSGSYIAHGPSAAATRLGLDLRDTPQSISVITRQQMDDQRLSNVAEVLDRTVGITNFRQGVGTDLDQIYSRGFLVSNYLVDGAPTVSDVNALRQNTAMFDRVEVVRGATGLMQGLGDPGAAINLVRKRPLREAQSGIDVEAGNWSRYGATLDLSRPFNDSGSARGRIVADIKDQHSWLDRYQSNTRFAYGVAEFDLDRDTLLTLGGNYQKNTHHAALRTGLPIYYSDGSRIDLPRSTNNAPDWTFYDNEQAGMFAALKRQFTNGWHGNAEFNHSRSSLDALSYYQEGSGSIDRVTGLGSSIAPSRWQEDIRTNSLDLYLGGPFSLFGRRHELVAGLGLVRSDTDTPMYGGIGGAGVGGWLWSWNSNYVGTLGDIREWRGAGLPAPAFSQNGHGTTRERTANAYATARFNLAARTNLVLGTRVVDWKRTTATDVFGGATTGTEQKESGVIVPYAGVVQGLNDNWSLYASYTSIFNPQSASMRDIDNRPLDPQEGAAYEAGIKAGLLDNRLNASFALFRIEQDKLAELNPLTNAYVLREGITTKGAELEVSGALARGWNVSAGYTYSLSHNQDGSRGMQRIPLNTVKAYSTYQLGGALDRLTVGGGFTWQTRNGWEGGQFAFQPSHAVARMMARYQASDRLAVSLNINNLFDKRYYAALLDNGVYGEPRSVMVSLKYGF